MAFDYRGAVAAGYNPAEINDHLAIQKKFDVAGARQSGYSEEEILGHLNAPEGPGIKDRLADIMPEGSLAQNLLGPTGGDTLAEAGATIRGAVQPIIGGVATAIGGGIAGVDAMTNELMAGRGMAGAREEFGRTMEDAGRATEKAFNYALGDPSDTAKQSMEKVTHALEWIRNKGGEIAATEVPFPGSRTIAGAVRELGIDTDALGRGIGEVAVDLAPVGPGGKGALAAAKRVPKTPAQYAKLRQMHPDLAGKTDAQILEWLNQKDLEINKEIGKPVNHEDIKWEKPDTTGLGKPEQPISAQDALKNPEAFDPNKGYTGAKPEMALEDPATAARRAEAIPYENKFLQYFAEKVPELVEKIKQSPTLQKLMDGVEETLDRMVALRDEAQRKLIEGTYLKPGNLSKEVQVKKDTRLDYENLNNRFTSQYDWAVKQITALGDELRQTALDHGWEMRDVNALSDWITERRDSLGPRPDVFAERPLDLQAQQNRALAIEKTQTGKERTAQALREMDPWRKLPQIEKTAIETSAKALPKADADIVTSKVEAGKPIPELIDAVRQGAPLSQLLDIVKQLGTPLEKYFAGILSKHLYRDPITGLDRVTVERYGGDALFMGNANRVLFKAPEKITAHAVLHEALHATIHWAFVKYGKLFRMHGIKALDILPPRERVIAESVLNIQKTWDALQAYLFTHQIKPSQLVESEKLLLDRIAPGGHDLIAEVFSNPTAVTVLNNISMKSLGLEGLGKTFTKVGDFVINQIKKLVNWGSMDDTVFKNVFQHGVSIMENLNKQDQFYFDTPESRSGPARMADPLVEQIRNELPSSYKHLAEQLAEEARSASPVRGKSPSEGTLALEKEFLSEPTAWSEVREKYLQLADIPGDILEKLGSMLTPGRQYAWIKQHGTLKYIVDTVDTGKRMAEIRSKQRVVQMLDSWKQMSKKEGEGLMKVILEYNGVRNLSEDALRSLGLNDAQVQAYQVGRKHFDQTLNDINAERVASGQEPVKPRPGYWPIFRKGNHLLYIYAHEGGPLLTVEPSNWKVALEHMGTQAKKAGYHYEIKDLPRRGDVKDTYGLFNAMLDTIGRDTPEAGAAREAMRMWKDKLSDQRRDFKEHFKKNQDLVGLNDYKTFLGAADGYFRDAYDYVYSKQTGRQMNKLLNEPDGVMDKQPNVHKFARHYWDNAQGWEGPFAKAISRAIEWLPEHFGLDRDLPANALHNAKQLAVTYMLGFYRGTFLLSQVWQPIQFMGPMLGYLEARSGIKLNTGLVMLEGSRATFEALTGMAKGFDAQMMKYAKDNNVIDPHFLEDMKSQGGVGGSKTFSIVSGRWAMQSAEKYSRLLSFMQTAYALKRLGVDGDKIGNMAHNITDIAMTNYRKHERALIYGKLGIVGDAISPLTTFRHNYAAQLYKYGKVLAQEGLTNPQAVKPLARMLVMQLVIAGSMGMIMRENVDHIIGLFRNLGLIDAKARSLTQVMLEESGKIESDAAKNGLRYGVGGLFGVDVSPTFSAANLLPTNSLQHGLSGLGDMFAIAKPIMEIGGDAGNVIKGIGKGTITTADWLQLAQNAPGALKGVAEEMVTDSTGMLRDPEKDMEGIRKRNVADRVARFTGARTAQESQEMTARSQNKLAEGPITEAKAAQVKAATKLAMAGRPYWTQLNEYIRLGGDPQTMIREIRQAIIGHETTQQERDQMKIKKPGQVESYDREQGMR